MWAFFSSDPVKSFPYEVGEKVTALDMKSIWSLHHGKKKVNGEAVSILTFDIKGSSETQMELAKSCYKRVKTLRHPNMLTYTDGLETEKVLYIVTEEVTPLEIYLHDSDINELAVSWGLFSVSRALSFLINDCSMIHNNVCMSSVFVNKAGDWLLGGVDFTYKIDGNNTVSVMKTLPMLEKYDPPEKSQSVVRGARWAVDSWGLGCLVWETFNGVLPKSSTLKVLGKIPKSLVSSYCELVGANAKSRPNPSKFIDNCRFKGGFMNNTFIDTMLFLEEIQIKDQNEKTTFFRNLTPSLESFPPQISRHKILPQLVNAFEYANSGACVLAPLLKVGKSLDSSEYQRLILPCVVKLFTSPDRNTRVKLLQQIETFIEHVPPSTVNDQIFPHIVQGFSDSNPVVREATIKAMTHMASKLNYKNLNEELMKHFARLQTKDDQGGIRTNTTICLGKIASYINPSIRQKILISAFVRATKDPFPPARQAGILAMAATQNLYIIKEIASKLCPTLCAMTLDPDKAVRDQAFKAIHGFIGKLEKLSEDPSCLEEMERDVLSGGSAIEGISGWAGWAVSGMTSLTSRIYKTRPKQGSQQTKPETSAPRKVETEQMIPANDKIPNETASSSDTNQGWDDGWGDIDNINDEIDERRLDKRDERRDDIEDDTSDWGDDGDWGSLETYDKQESPVNDTSQLVTTSSYFSQQDDSGGDFSSQLTHDTEKQQHSRLKQTNSQQQKQCNSKSIRSHISQNKPTKSDHETPQPMKSHHDTTQPIKSQVDSGWTESGWGDDASDWATQDVEFEDNESRKRREREEKRQQRQQELETKRGERKAGAMKLGVKKLTS